MAWSNSDHLLRCVELSSPIRADVPRLRCHKRSSPDRYYRPQIQSLKCDFGSTNLGCNTVQDAPSSHNNHTVSWTKSTISSESYHFPAPCRKTYKIDWRHLGGTMEKAECRSPRLRPTHSSRSYALRSIPTAGCNISAADALRATSPATLATRCQRAL